MSQTQLSSTNIQVTSTSSQILESAKAEKVFSSTNVVNINSYGCLQDQHPLAPLAGILSDNPLCNEYLEILGIVE